MQLLQHNTCKLVELVTRPKSKPQSKPTGQNRPKSHRNSAQQAHIPCRVMSTCNYPMILLADSPTPLLACACWTLPTRSCSNNKCYACTSTLSAPSDSWTTCKAGLGYEERIVLLMARDVHKRDEFSQVNQGAAGQRMHGATTISLFTLAPTCTGTHAGQKQATDTAA